MAVKKKQAKKKTAKKKAAKKKTAKKNTKPVAGKNRNENNLLVQQQAFCDHLLADPSRNATLAYMKAYPDTSENAAKVSASKLLTTPNVAAYINKRLEQLTERANLTQERILQELSAIAFMDPGELLTDTGDLKPLQDLPRHVRACIASFEIVTETIGKGENAIIEYVRKIRFHSKPQALDMAMKYFNMYSGAPPDQPGGQPALPETVADEIPFSQIRKKAIDVESKRID